MTLNEILRACFILFTPLLLILHTCSVRLSHGWICKRILNQGASSPAVLLFFRDNAPAPHESTGSFVFFLWTLHQPLGPRLPQTSNTVYANSLPEAALTVWVKDQMHLKLSAFLTRGQNGPLNGHMAAADVAVWRSILRGRMNMLWIQLLHKSCFFFSKEEEISPNFHSQLEESESVLTVTCLRLSLLQSGCDLTFWLWRQVIPKH